MPEVLISIRPEWVEKILNLEKRWELRKNRPAVHVPFRCFIYKTGNGGVVGEFTCDYVDWCVSDNLTKEWLKESCVPIADALEYAAGKTLFKWRIRSLIVYPEPRPLSQYGLETPPQSWCYLKNEGSENNEPE